MPLFLIVRDLRSLLTNKWPRMVANYPFITLLVALALTSCAVILVAVYATLPSFDDPLIGFEARGTDVAKRINTWKLINGQYHLKNSDLSLYPYDYNKQSGEGVDKIKIPVNLEDDEEEQEKLRLAADQMNSSGRVKPNATSNVTMCTQLTDQYVHFVAEVSSGSLNPGSKDLLTLDNLRALCELDYLLRLPDEFDDEQFSSFCETGSSTQCCLSWSLPNYVALMANKSSCREINELDMNNFKELMQVCASAYHQNTLTPNCFQDNEQCPKAPAKCYDHGNLVFNVMHYLVESGYLKNPKNIPIVQVTNIFLPLAKSAKLVDYFTHLTEKGRLQVSQVAIVAADMGVKQALFERLLLEDTKLLVIALLIVLTVLWLYVQSILIVLTCSLSLVASIGITYLIYTYIYNISYFPFMNMMTIVILVGVGVDNTFVCCSIWYSLHDKFDKEPIYVRVRETFRLSVTSTFFTSVTTAGALLSSYSSSISAIRCFSIFSATAVLINFACNSLLLSCALVINRKYLCRSSSRKVSLFSHCRSFTSRFGQIMFNFIKCFKHLIVIVFACAALSAIYVIMYMVKLPNSYQVQTFKSSHLFEAYDSTYRQKFSFRKQLDEDGEIIFPVSFVFGAKPSDSGSYLDPFNRGTVDFDEHFDIADNRSQVWLHEFCKKLRNTSFYKPINGPQLGNCFIETFRTWIEERPCFDNITNGSNEPCCNSASFPFKRKVFDLCLGKAIELLHRTPTYVISQDAPGPRFSKSNSKVLVVVIEYYSHFNFSNSFEHMTWVLQNVSNWMDEALKDAPDGLKSGWFVNNYLELYALQEALLDGTKLAVPFALVGASVSLILSTQDLVLSFAALASVLFIILSTIGSLILMGWEVNIVESITISAAAGMAVDFPLHFIIAYKHTDQGNYGWQRTFECIKVIGKPLSLAALTTGLAGCTMTLSRTLAYGQVGTFLTVISVFNFLFVFLFLTALFLIIDSRRGERILVSTNSAFRTESLEMNGQDLVELT